MKDKENRTFAFGLILMFVCGVSVAIDFANKNYIQLAFSVTGVIIGYLKVIKTID